MSDRPRVAIVSSAELEPGAPLSPDYYVNRKPSETYPAYKNRREIERLISVLERDLHRIHVKLERIRALLEES